ISAELRDAQRLLPKAAKALRRALLDPEPEVRQSALAALGSLGLSEDAPRLAQSLEDARAIVRDAAALGLSRLGPAARPILAAALSPRRAKAARLAAATAAAQSFDPETVLLLKPLLSDPDEGVRLHAIAALSELQATTRPLLREFAPELDRLKNGDP